MNFFPKSLSLFLTLLIGLSIACNLTKILSILASSGMTDLLYPIPRIAFAV